MCIVYTNVTWNKQTEYTHIHKHIYVSVFHICYYLCRTITMVLSRHDTNYSFQIFPTSILYTLWLLVDVITWWNLLLHWTLITTGKSKLVLTNRMSLYQSTYPLATLSFSLLFAKRSCTPLSPISFLVYLCLHLY